jgi:low temperature requirement protein LtrA
MKGIVVPDIEEDFTADPVELFFDLAFVFGFSRLVHELVNHHTWADVGKVSLLFMMMWLGWSQFTWSANAVPGNQRLVRAVFLVATVLSVPMAASIDSAYDDGGPVFALALSAIILMAMTLYITNIPRGTNAFRSIVKISGITLVSLSVICIGGFLEGQARVITWVAALGIFAFAMAVAGSGEFLVRSGHFAERHGLIIIIALGEVIVAVGIPVLDALSESGLDSGTTVALFAAGAFAALLWWAYFDRAYPALEHRAEGVGPLQRGRFARDVYTIAHMPIVGGVILSAATIEEIALHPRAVIELPFQLMLVGGLGLWLLGVSMAVAIAFGVWVKERTAAGLAIAALIFLGSDLDGVVLLVGVDLILLAMLAAEHYRVEGRGASAS